MSPRSSPPRRDGVQDRGVAGKSNRLMATGWCSWYELMDSVNENLLVANADAIQRLARDEGVPPAPCSPSHCRRRMLLCCRHAVDEINLHGGVGGIAGMTLSVLQLDDGYTEHWVCPRPAPCLALPCPALPCLALPCPALPCLALETT
jgi:hypothetical protein